MAVVVILDRITKIIAESSLADGAVSVIGDTVRFQLVYNPGAAFGLGDELGMFSRWFFMLVAAIAVVVLHRMSRDSRPDDTIRQYAVGLVAGGAAGNLIDRVISSRGVVDFIDVGVGMTRWPTFNIADIAVSCGAVALALSLWQEDARRRDQSAS
jgi:signal peptidase II